jgi:hypothetical protein
MLMYEVGGPKRPPMPKEPPRPKQPLITWGKPPEEAPKAAAIPSRTAVAKQRAPTRDHREREDV